MRVAVVSLGGESVSQTNPEPSEPHQAEPEAANRETRRDAVRRLGRYAAYTAPALMAFLAGTTTASASL